jgi:hypothetical protein
MHIVLYLQEENEVLKSIYDGDENFKQIDEKTYQYKVQISTCGGFVIKQLKLNEIKCLKSRSYCTCIHCTILPLKFL